MYKYIICGCLLLLFVCPSSKAQNAPTVDTLNLRVGIAGSAPFVITAEGQRPKGIAIEIWQSIAREAGWQYSSKQFADIPSALAALKNDSIDILVGPTSITSNRANIVRFSQPYYQSSLSILSRAEDLSVWQRIKPFFSEKLLIAVIIFLFILCCVGTLLWLAERKASPQQFPPQPARGIANGMWCAIVTMSTTGYGDIAPATFLGRIIAGAWMIISLLSATTMVAGIASTLTLTGMSNSTISKAEELAGKKVAVVMQTPAAQFAKENGGKNISVDNLQEGYQLLKQKKVDAVVFDRPQLLYYLRRHPNENMAISQAQYEKQGYGIAFPLHSKLTHEANIHLLQLSEGNGLKQIVQEWLHEKD